NPGARGAQGSNTVTSTAAAINTREADNGRRSMAATATVASMKKVLCAGTPQPASRQYSQATTSATPAATTWAGARSARGTPRQLMRFHAHNASAAASAASMVT